MRWKEIDNILDNIDILDRIVGTREGFRIDQLPGFLFEESCQILRGRHYDFEYFPSCFRNLGQLISPFLVVVPCPLALLRFSECRIDEIYKLTILFAVVGSASPRTRESEVGKKALSECTCQTAEHDLTRATGCF
jgi:hypothetical protein